MLHMDAHVLTLLLVGCAALLCTFVLLLRLANLSFSQGKEAPSAGAAQPEAPPAKKHRAVPGDAPAAATATTSAEQLAARAAARAAAKPVGEQPPSPVPDTVGEHDQRRTRLVLIGAMGLLPKGGPGHATSLHAAAGACLQGPHASGSWRAMQRPARPARRGRWVAPQDAIVVVTPGWLSEGPSGLA